MPDRTTPTIGFRGPYAPREWEKGRIVGGKTEVAGLPDDPAGCQFKYAVKLDGGGVPERKTRFQVRAAASGIVSFDYRYEFYHAWFQVQAQFDVFADSDRTLQMLQVLRFVGPQSVGPQVFCGSVAVYVQKGRHFGIILGGSNFDSDSRLEGTLTITAFAAPVDAEWVPPAAVAVAAEPDRPPDEPPPRKRRRLGGPPRE
jgi:hypothetical protein